jgi:hypothetical protein
MIREVGFMVFTVAGVTYIATPVPPGLRRAQCAGATAIGIDRGVFDRDAGYGLGCKR